MLERVKRKVPLHVVLPGQMAVQLPEVTEVCETEISDTVIMGLKAFYRSPILHVFMNYREFKIGGLSGLFHSTPSKHSLSPWLFNNLSSPTSSL